jgi:hypothetical protein
VPYRGGQRSSGTAIRSPLLPCAFGKIEALGWRAELTAADGVREIIARLEAGTLECTMRTITLAWYQELLTWQQRLRGLEIDGHLLDTPLAAG